MKNKMIDNIEICIECNEKPVLIKKRKLCVLCYGRLKNKTNRVVDPNNHQYCKATLKKHDLAREIKFIKNYFAHTNYIHQPATFRLNDTIYSPDFYDSVRNVFIEVAGTRQAYHRNKHKYKLMREIFPLINFEVRKTDGSLLNEDSRDKNW